MLRSLLLASLIAAPLPAIAQVAPASFAAPAPSLSSDAAIGRFYATPREPLWVQGGTVTAAGQLVLERLRTADAEGYDEGPALARRIDAALATPGTDPIAVDRLLSQGWIGLVGAIQGPIAGAKYFNTATRPTVELPDRTLYLAANAPDRTAYVTGTLRKSRIYEDLRTAMLADAAANGGRVDPRLAANLKRARVLPASGRYLFVNPATAKLMLVENGAIKDQMKVVVGTAVTPTYPMASRIYFAILNPYWNVAEDLVKKIVAPHAVAQGLSYIKSRNYEVIDKYGEGATIIPASTIDWKAVLAGTEKVKMRQKPSATNSMGKMKFPFANDYGIFLHDTVNKPQFASDSRANSNGCIRLEDAPRMARWLFGTEPKVSGDIPDEAVRLPEPINVYVAYITASPTGRGIEYAKDVYSLDPVTTASGAL